MKSRFRCVLTTVESDSHIWNLVYLQMVIEEQGGEVRNLGACTPVEEVVRTVAEDRPDLLVVSSVNGDGSYGALEVLSALHERDLRVPCVVGGKLTTSVSAGDQARRELLAAGYTDVFLSDDAIANFVGFLNFGVAEGFASWKAQAAPLPPWADAAQAAEVS
ncbi:methylmalonyl-CoA mutase [Nocardia panacis]|uniref:Methylmalonyl-CoA mutase n=1 Tax=Nocardia panacis TaxID=2340916 RepID=A0A3A4KE19_9NOCA|nr:cobalamin-dependent protein [Nocardia panacis]RJO70699.1 methylmalonyl-CoA mutase [Nocardia panacis]